MTKANVTFHRVLRDGNVVVKLIATVEASTEQLARELAKTDIRGALPLGSVFANREWTWEKDQDGNEIAEVEWLR